MLGGVAELIITMVATLMLMAAFLPIQQNALDSQLAATAAWEIAAVRDAAAQYIKDHWAQIQPAAVTPQLISVATLQSSRYLLGGGPNPYRQNHAVLVVQSGSSGLLGVVVSYGGNQIPANRLLTAAALIGKYGGYVPYYAADPNPCGSPCVKGIGSTWTQSMAAFQSAAATAAYVPTSGHLAAGIFFQGGEQMAPYLCRYYQPGNPDCTVMHADLDMGGHSIANAFDVTATDQVLSARFTDLGNSGYYVVPSGTSNLNAVAVSSLTAGTSVTSPIFLHSSDERLKKNIRDIELPLELVRRLKGHRFQWRADDTEDVGLVAQEVREIVPEAVRAGPDGMLAVKYDIMVAPLIEAVKVLAGQVDELQSRVDASGGGERPGR